MTAADPISVAALIVQLNEANAKAEALAPEYHRAVKEVAEIQERIDAAFMALRDSPVRGTPWHKAAEFDRNRYAGLGQQLAHQGNLQTMNAQCQNEVQQAVMPRNQQALRQGKI